MNTKILKYLLEDLRNASKLDSWIRIQDSINESSVLLSLPWTPARLEKFKQDITDTFDVEPTYDGTVADLANDIDYKYAARFWGSIWQPKTDVYQYTGWSIVDEILKREPKKVLDVGCGYNQFKQRIPNLIGLDKYNNSADYMVDVLEYNVDDKYDAVIVLGSINFGEYEDIAVRFKKVFDLTAPGGRIYVRANPGETHKNGPWVQIYPWDFETAHKIARENDAELITFKKDNSNRLYFVYEKSNG